VIKIALIGLFFAVSTQADQFDMDARLKRAGFKKDQVGIVVVVDGANKIAINGQRSFTPASLAKIVTAYSALKAFSPGHRFVTRICKGGDDIYLVGGGDPSFVSERLWFLVNEFVRTGIRKVGNVYVDDSLFDDEKYSQTRQKERVQRAYDAPVSAMSFNWNSLNVFVRPSKKAGDSAVVYLDPENKHVRLINKAKTSKSGKTRITANRSFKNNVPIVTVSGSIPRGAKEKVFYRGIREPALWAGYNLAAFLGHRGIKVSGRVQRKQLTGDCQELAKSEGRDTAHVVKGMMKFSSNFTAEMLTKNMSLADGKKTGSLDKGLAYMKRLVGEMGFDWQSLKISNPSGFSNRVEMKPQALVKFLQIAKSDFEIFPEFLSAFPIAGIDGTLKSRMSSVAGRVRAKTGLLNGVVGLAGYAQTADKKEVVFSMIYNGPDRPLRAQKFFDQLVTDILK
jgi:D-alanyl-D-alanine carboxypeptidase/D-alanyl-D-alanine-endopeptidase (penicillin-binding protein 4)